MSGPGPESIDVESWAAEHFGLFSGSFTAPEDAAASIGGWIAAAREASGDPSVLLAGPFQRHLTARGTGLPSNFCLLLSTAEVVARKLDPANTGHPALVGAGQIGKEVSRRPLGSVRFTGLEHGKLADGMTLEIDGAKPVPCRTPKLRRNPAAAIVLHALGLQLPAPG